jgi:GNAT superfamily N-acetyltransferase
VTRYTIALGRPEHARELRAIESAAGRRFVDIGMADVAEGEPTPAAILEDRAQAGRLYAAFDEHRRAAGFLIWSPKDGRAYIEEVSVHPGHAGHRLAARMIDRLAEDVRGRHAALSLTTFRDVPWNAPYYAKLGFVELARADAGPEHEASWLHQEENGLDMTRRLFMTRAVA